MRKRKNRCFCEQSRNFGLKAQESVPENKHILTYFTVKVKKQKNVCWFRCAQSLGANQCRLHLCTGAASVLVRQNSHTVQRWLQHEKPPVTWVRRKHERYRSCACL